VMGVSAWIPATVAGMIFWVGGYFLLYPSVVPTMILGITCGACLWTYLKLESEKLFPWDEKFEWSRRMPNVVIFSAVLVGTMLVVKESAEFRLFLQLQMLGAVFFGQLTGWRQGYWAGVAAKSRR
jgi:hypothetical protein